jgi:hypothetical protein
MDPAVAIYVVYVWHGEGSFRASARSVDGEPMQRFDAAEALLGYLLRAPSRAVDVAETGVAEAQPRDRTEPG